MTVLNVEISLLLIVRETNERLLFNKAHNADATQVTTARRVNISSGLCVVAIREIG
jgi:hypothetical protein